MKIVTFFCILTSLCIISCAAKPDGQSTLHQIDLLEKFNCEQTVMSYAHSRDQVDGQKNAALFTPDAVMQFGATKLQGHDEIKAALLDRGPQKFTRHIITSVSIERALDGGLEGTSYAVVYSADPKIEGPKPLKQDSVEVILTYNDSFEITDNRCLIAKRTVTLDMVKQDEQ